MIDQGLIDYYASQAQLMLVQYHNINQLLGLTNDWTHPGIHCEVLLRDMIRKSLPSKLSADKGFIYGREDGSTKPTHCPEIDILIHDSLNFRPIFRLEDLVIVEANAVCGVIQIKRTLTQSQLNSGLTNVIKATNHYKKNLKHKGAVVENYFSAIVGFAEGIGRREDGKPSETYKTEIRKDGLERDGATWYPDFIGSLDGLVLLHRGNHTNDIGYQIMPSMHNSTNIALQAFLAQMSHKVLYSGSQPPFSFPEGIDVLEYFSIWKAPSA
jgi:hypothetical protein